MKVKDYYRKMVVQHNIWNTKLTQYMNLTLDKSFTIEDIEKITETDLKEINYHLKRFKRIINRLEYAFSKEIEIYKKTIKMK